MIKILLMSLLIVSCGKKGGGGSDAAPPNYIENKSYINLIDEGENFFVMDAVYLYDDNTFMILQMAGDTLVSSPKVKVWFQAKKGNYQLVGEALEFEVLEETCTHTDFSGMEVFSPDYNKGLIIKDGDTTYSFDFSDDIVKGGDGSSFDSEYDFIFVEDTKCDWQDFIDA